MDESHFSRYEVFKVRFAPSRVVQLFGICKDGIGRGTDLYCTNAHVARSSENIKTRLNILMTFLETCL